MSSALDAFVGRAVASYQANSPIEFDPTIIIVIAEIVIEMIIKLQEECDVEPERAQRMANNPTGLQQRLLTLVTRRMLGRQEWKNCGPEVVDSVLQAGIGVTLQETEALYEEVQDNFID